MRAARLKGGCTVCQAPEVIRVAVNIAVWHEGSTVRTANYRAAGVRAASQVAVTIGPDADRYKELDPKTISRHADHVEESWRDLPAGERLEDGEVPIAHDFGNVMDTGAELGMMSMRGLRDVIRRDPEAFAALRTKEAVSIAKLGIAAASSKETSRIKRNQQAIDVMAIFAHSSGFLPSLDTDQDDEARDSVDAMRGEVAAERLALEAG